MQNIDDDHDNFNKAILRYQSREIDVPDSVYDELDAYFSAWITVGSAEEVKARPLDERGRREGTSLDLLRRALSTIDSSYLGMDEHAITQIAKKYWGWKLPTLSQAQCEEIIRSYEEIERKYEH